MSDPSDTLIDDLAGALRPVRPLKARGLWIGAAVAVVLAALYIFFSYGPRPEIAAFVHGQGMKSQMAWVNPCLFLVTVAGSLWAVAVLTRPEGRLRWRTLGPLMLALAGEVGALIGDALVKWQNVKLSAFGSFQVRSKNERIGRNPKTGEEVPILPRQVLVFKPSNVLKSKINKSMVRAGK